MRKSMITLIVCLGLSAASAEELVVAFNVPTTFAKPIIEGTTNLPDGTRLEIWLQTPQPCRPNCQFETIETTVKGGRFSAGPFPAAYGTESPRYRPDQYTHRLPMEPGIYTLRILLWGDQPEAVWAIIGRPYGRNLSGPYMKEWDPQWPYLMLDYTSQITILANHSALGPWRGIIAHHTPIVIVSVSMAMVLVRAVAGSSRYRPDRASAASP